MSSQSSVYDDPVECFDKLSLDDSFNGTNTSACNLVAAALQQSTDDKTDKDKSDPDAPSDYDKNDYSEEYFNIGEQHRLENKWTIWFSKLSKTQTVDDYESKLKVVGKFETCEQFWTLYSYLKRPHEFETLTEIHIFKDGIKPLWEHHKNKDGGKFVIRLKKGVISRLWENLLIAVLGEQFLVGDQINGCVLSIRHHFDSISLWNLNAKNKQVINHIRETLRRVLNLNDSSAIDYKVFNHRPNQN